MRPLIALLPLLTALIAGCDRQSQAPQQANQATSAPTPTSLAAKLDRSHKGEPAPAYAFVDAKGVKHTLADFRGKPVLVNLWATWCAPCIKEMPTLDALAVRGAGKLQVVTISQDTDADKTQAYFEKAGFKALALYLDGEMAFSLGMGANLPTTVLYNAAGKEVWRVAGEMDWSEPPAELPLFAGA